MSFFSRLILEHRRHERLFFSFLSLTCQYEHNELNILLKELDILYILVLDWSTLSPYFEWRYHLYLSLFEILIENVSTKGDGEDLRFLPDARGLYLLQLDVA